jgi:nitrogen fixation NifU-like protein
MTVADSASLAQQLILDHAAAGEGQGDPTGFHPQSHQVNPTCGDEITLGIRVDGDRIDDVRWDGRGCAISQASASLLTGLVVGGTTQQAIGLIDEFRSVMRSRGEQELDEARFADAVALNGVSRYVARVKCAMLAWVALEQALEQASAQPSV